MDDFPDISDDELEAAFRALDPQEMYDLSMRGPGIVLAFRYEDPHLCFTSGDEWWQVLYAMPEDLREAVLNLCEVLGPVQRRQRGE